MPRVSLRISIVRRCDFADSAYRQSLIDAAVEPLPDWTTEQFSLFMAEDIKRWNPLVQKLGIAID